jgi:hypothetical protein
MTPAQQIESTIFQITINPDPNSSVGPKVGERPGVMHDVTNSVMHDITPDYTHQGRSNWVGD